MASQTTELASSPGLPLLSPIDYVHGIGNGRLTPYVRVRGWHARLFGGKKSHSQAACQLANCKLFINHHHLQLLASACSSMLEGDYDSELENSKLILVIAAEVKNLCSCPDEAMVSFSKWLYTVLFDIIAVEGW